MARASVVFPEPRSPLSATTSGGRAARPKRCPQSISSDSVRARCPFAASGGRSGEWPSIGRAASTASARAARRLSLLRRRRPASAQLEEPIAQLCRQLEVHVRGGLAHLLLEHLLERLRVHYRVAPRGLGNASLLTIGRAGISDARNESHLIHALRYGRRSNPVDAIVLHLQLTTTPRLFDATLHRSGDAVGIEDRASMNVPRGAANGLDQGSVTAEEPFL